MYNLLLNLNCAKQTRAISFADDLLIAAKAASVEEVENFINMEMSKITQWSKHTRTKKSNWIGHILRKNCLRQRVIEGKIQGG